MHGIIQTIGQSEKKVNVVNELLKTIYIFREDFYTELIHDVCLYQTKKILFNSFSVSKMRFEKNRSSEFTKKSKKPPELFIENSALN